MSNKFQPGEEMFDDLTQGHVYKMDRDDPAIIAQDEDTEGHIRLQALPEDEDAEGTEGHRAFYAFPQDQPTKGIGDPREF